MVTGIFRSMMKGKLIYKTKSFIICIRRLCYYAFKMREDGVVGDCDLLGRIKVKLTVKFALTFHKDVRVGGTGVPLPSLHPRR